MFPEGFRRRRHNGEEAGKAQYASPWSARDKARLQELIDPLNKRFGKQAFGFLKSESSTLLCTPPSEIYERITSFLSNISIVSGLVLSSIASSALSPLDPNSFPAGKQNAAEVFNMMAAIAVGIQLCVVLYSTFTLYILISSAHNSTAIYRALVYMSKWIGFFEFCTFIPALTFFSLIILATYLHCSILAFWIVLGVCCGSVVIFQNFFILMCMGAFPYNCWAWASVFGGVPWLSKRLQIDAKTHGEILATQAADGVLSGLDEDRDGLIDTETDKSHAGTAATEAELTMWVHRVLDLTPTGSELLAKGLLSAGLTRSRIIEAAQQPGGFQALCDILAMQPFELRPGDRLALASAAMRDSALIVESLPSDSSMGLKCDLGTSF